MSFLEIGLYSITALLVMIFLRAPIGLAMLLCGMGGLYLATGSPNMILARMKEEAYATFSNYSLSIIPMFLLMGQFSTVSGMSAALFKAAESWLGHRRGGVAMASVGACAGFGAICGSSLATAATMGRVALPEMKRYGYPSGFASATLAAGGTLGILIPPSVILVIYAIITEQNIAKLFLAAFVPGVLAALGYMAVIAIYARVNPAAAVVMPKLPLRARFAALWAVWPVLVVFGLVVFGIYLGWFTPTEGAAVGAAGTGIIALASGNLTWAALGQSILSTARSTAMIFFIILGAGFYNGFLAMSRLPQELSGWIGGLEMAPLAVFAVILLFYLVMGCVLDSLSMILLTVPIFFPVMQGLDFGLSPEHLAIWFGILVLIVVEVGLITPPVGMNLFIIRAMDAEAPITDTYRAVVWFVLADILRVVLLVLFPSITLFLIA